MRENKEKLLFYPAAVKLHHATRGGWLHHTWTLTKLAKSIIDIYPALDGDLIYTGAILHDIGKLEGAGDGRARHRERLYGPRYVGGAYLHRDFGRDGCLRAAWDSRGNRHAGRNIRCGASRAGGVWQPEDADVP